MRNWFNIALLMFIPAMYCMAQNSWNLTIAFEDATEAKDTIRIFWDEEATFEFDSIFHEFPVEPNGLNEFEVLWYSPNLYPNLYFESIAYPWLLPGLDGVIQAFNFIEPITISYNSQHFTDPNLFPFLQDIFIRGELHNDFFFFGGFDDPCSCFQMSDHDSVVLVDTSIPGNEPYAPHFPIFFYFFRSTTIGTENQNIYDFKLYPNPTLDAFLNIESGEARFSQFEMWDMQGREVLRGALNESRSSHAIDINDLPAGPYILKLFDGKGQSVQKRFVKSTN
jgi:hypothetical protein